MLRHQSPFIYRVLFLLIIYSTAFKTAYLFEIFVNLFDHDSKFILRFLRFEISH